MENKTFLKNKYRTQTFFHSAEHKCFRYAFNYSN